MSSKNHPFHIVEPSPWPISTAFSLLFLTLGAAMLMHGHAIGKILFPLGTIGLFFCLYSWWGRVIKEGRVEKSHSSEVRNGLRIGMAIFILSEVMFFFAFFWSFFKASLFPEGILQGIWDISAGSWPPKGIETFDPWDVPFMNTLILLLSGTTVTWAHYAMDENNLKDCAKALGYTVLLGICFTCLQAYEYIHASFTLSGGIYGSNFFMATGFHGAHVIIGTIFLAICYFRAKKGHFREGEGRLAFEFASWYWHFVDVVWLFLFVFLYVWGR